MGRENNAHLNRESYYDIAESVWDDYKNLGYQYKGMIFRNSISSLFYSDKRKVRIIDELEKMIYHLLEHVKMIKKFRNFAIKKNSHRIN